MMWALRNAALFFMIEIFPFLIMGFGCRMETP